MAIRTELIDGICRVSFDAADVDRILLDPVAKNLGAGSIDLDKRFEHVDQSTNWTRFLNGPNLPRNAVIERQARSEAFYTLVAAAISTARTWALKDNATWREEVIDVKLRIRIRANQSLALETVVEDLDFDVRSNAFGTAVEIVAVEAWRNHPGRGPERSGPN